MSNPTLSQQLAQALLLEQVRFAKQQLLNSPHTEQLQQFIQHTLQYAEQIQLHDVIQVEQLQQVVEKYALQLNLGPELLEFIGSISQHLHLYIIGTQTCFSELLSDDTFEQWLNKILELDQARLYLRELIQNNEKTQQISLQLANQILEKYTPWLDQLRKPNNVQNRYGQRILHFLQEQQQTIEFKLEQQLSKAILEQLGEVLTLPKNELAEMVLHLWSDIKHHHVSDYLNHIEAIDVEDFFILVYESWRGMRQSNYIRQLINEGIQAFYDHFADSDLKSLLQAVGLDQQDLLEEAQRFAPYALQALERLQLLDSMLEGLLRPFYEASGTHQVIDQFLQEQTQ